jgi:hypothetical protein
MMDLQLKKVSNICIVLNDNKVYRDQYEYGYGYYNKGRSGIRTKNEGKG